MNAPQIILMISCFVALSMGAILLTIAKTYPKSIRGLSEWSLAAIAIGLSLPLFIGRGVIPDVFSIVLANLMILIGFMMMNQGVRNFAGAAPRANDVWLVLFVLAYVSLFVWFTYVQPDIGMRVATMSLFTLVVILDQLVLVLQALPRTAGRNIMAASLVILIVPRVIRIGGLMLGFEPPSGVFDPSIPQLVYVAIPSITIPLGTISLIMLAAEKLHRDLEFISRYDDLTQCLNKKAAMEELQREIAWSRRHGNKLSIMLIDLDNFKDINDTHGHLEGDKVLADFSGKTKAALRDTDRLTRFGGDEFLAILPDTDVEHAAHIADRLHEAGKSGQPIAWSVSIGISEWLGQDDTLAALQTRADKALYKAKAMGRKQTQSI
jgi:diguanylate cyclase (GGDEF)-like protein